MKLLSLVFLLSIVVAAPPGMASFSKENTCDNLRTIDNAFRLVEDELPAARRMAAYRQIGRISTYCRDGKNEDAHKAAQDLMRVRTVVIGGPVV